MQNNSIIEKENIEIVVTAKDKRVIRTRYKGQISINGFNVDGSIAWTKEIRPNGDIVDLRKCSNSKQALEEEDKNIVPINVVNSLIDMANTNQKLFQENKSLLEKIYSLQARLDALENTRTVEKIKEITEKAAKIELSAGYYHSYPVVNCEENCKNH